MNIKLNVSGKIFETTIDTLMKIPYFNNMFGDCGNVPNEILFVNRPHHIFKHVLSYVIDQRYPYPLKYAFELDYYDIKYNVSDLYDKHKSIEIRLDNMQYTTNKTARLMNIITPIIQYKLNDATKCLHDDCNEYACDDCNYCGEHYDYGEYCDTRHCDKRRISNSFYCDDINHYQK